MIVTAALSVLLSGCAVNGTVTAEEQEPASATPPRPCQSEEYRQFDFWIGDWDVLAGGKKAGENRIGIVNDGCALMESYTTPGAYRGHSFNIYDRTRKVWHQTWVDNAGLLLTIEGGLQDGIMVMTGTAPRDTPRGEVLDRISWTPQADGTVRQLWEVSADQGETWNPIFDGTYRRKAAADRGPAQE